MNQKKRMAFEISWLASQLVKDLYYMFIYFNFLCGLIILYSVLSLQSVIAISVIANFCRIIIIYSQNNKHRFVYFIDQIILMIFKVQVILFLILNLNKLSLLTIPLLVSFLIRVYLYNAIKYVHNIQKSQQIVILIFKLILIGQYLLVCLKQDTVIQWNWIVVLWPLILVLCINLFFTAITIGSIGMEVFNSIVHNQYLQKPKIVFLMTIILFQLSIIINILLLYNYFQFGEVVLIIIFMPSWFVTYLSFLCRHLQIIEKYLNESMLNDKLEIVQHLPRQPQILQKISENFFRPLDSTKTTANTEMIINNLHLDQQKAERELKCSICMDLIANRVLMPCGHGGFCKLCVKDAKLCFLCRNPIETILKTEHQNGDIILVVN